MKKTHNLVRRIAVLALALILISALLSSCGETLNAYKLLVRAVEKTQALDSYEVDMTSNTSLKMSILSVDVPITANIRVADATSDTPRMDMDISTTILGEATEMSLYSENNVYYMDVLGQKVKTTNASDVSSMGMGIDTKTMLVMIPEALLANTQIEKEANGNRSITVVMDGETFSKHYSSIAESAANESLGAGTKVDEIKLTEATVIYYINNDNYVAGVRISFGMSLNMSLDGISDALPCEGEIEMSLNYVNPGQPVEVTAPEDLNLYLDLELLG